MSRLKKLKKIRIHREGTHTLAGSLLLLLVVNSALYFGLECKLPFYIVAVGEAGGTGIETVHFIVGGNVDQTIGGRFDFIDAP